MKLLDKRSFTLLEVIIVLAMMGFVYTLAITQFSKNTVQKENTYFNLKKVILDYTKNSRENNSNIELICLEDSIYIIKVDGEVIKSNNFKLPKDIEFFTYHQDDTLKDEFEPYYYDEHFQDVIFRFNIYNNNSSTKAIVKIKDKYFIQPNYFRLNPSDQKIFNDDYEAKEYL